MTDEMTLVDVLVESLGELDAVPDGQGRPVCILWMDPHEEFMPLIPLLRERMPQLLTVASYDPAARSGPAIWARWMLEQPSERLGALPGEGKLPILYLPGVSRRQLQSGEDCPPAVRPLVFLLYRGAKWVQSNGRDWTPSAFVASPAVGWQLAEGAGVTAALHRALPRLAHESVASRRGRVLGARDFDDLVVPDLPYAVLRWLAHPDADHADPVWWEAFTQECRDRLAVDPSREGPLAITQRLMRAGDPLNAVWERFAREPGHYEGVPELLDRVAAGGLPADCELSRVPARNRAAEADAVKTLEAAWDSPAPKLRAQLLTLEEEHGVRREWVWAKLGQAPLATALAPLAEMARRTEHALAAGTWDDLARQYMDGAYRADLLAWRVLADLPIPYQPVMQRVVAALMRPWLEDSAHEFQRLLDHRVLPGPKDQAVVRAEPGECVVFVDGLRFDLAALLSENLTGSGLEVCLGHRWAARPTVTATGKPAVTPVAERVVAGQLGEDFQPTLAPGGGPADAHGLRRALEAEGYQVMTAENRAAPAGPDARGWSEFGNVDSTGHEFQDDLPRHLQAELTPIENHVAALLEAGWSSVRVVTDHGWLFLPGGLPRVDLPKYLTDSRWKRCAVIAGASQVDVPTVPWYWNPAERVAVAPGIACFNASPSYTHGGLTVQECLTPDLRVRLRRGGDESLAGRIVGVTWRQMRCFVEVATSSTLLTADLVLDDATGRSVTAGARPVAPDATVSLVVADEAFEHARLLLVLKSADGTVVAQRPTRVGENS